MFQYGNHPRQISCTALTTLLVTIFTLRKGKLNGAILLHVFLFLSGSVDGIQCICALVLIILNIETFVTFDFDPSLNSKFITDFRA